MTAPDHLFVNNIRFLGMLGIIAVHTRYWPDSFSGNIAQAAIEQVFKFGTICFFMISGYLLGSKIQASGRLAYYKKRLRNTFKPWLTWASIYAGLFMLLSLRDGFSLKTLFGIVWSTLFYTNYWFIPNFFIALGILLVMQAWFNRPWFAALLALAAAAYGVNLYAEWVPTAHTAALLGFVFYLWLGVQIHGHEPRIRAVLDRTPYWFLWLVVGVFFAVSLLEGSVLSGHTSDALNTLRISNQLFSLSVFFLLMKVKRKLSPGWMNVRRHTFGLYLIHWIPTTLLAIALGYLLPVLIGVPRDEFLTNPLAYSFLPERLLVWFASFTVVYGGTWALTAFLARGRHAALVGAPVLQPVKRSA